MTKYIVLLMLLIHRSYCVLQLNDTEYERMPPLVHLDDYESCFYDSNATYCTTELRLVSETQSDLLNLIRNYSEQTLTRYDHGKLYYGVCVTRSCNKSTQEILRNLNISLEACLNDTLWKNYNLNVKLSTLPKCYTADDKMELDVEDIIVAMMCSSIVIINLCATLYDMCRTAESQNKGVNILLCFSIYRNWARLVNSDYRSKPIVGRLKGIDGIRVITMILLVIGHSFIPYATSAKNLQFTEQMYHYLPYHIILNAAIGIQCFFVISGFLLSYNIQRSAEQRKLHWTFITSSIFKRWLRLTPSYAIVIAILSTWLRFMGSGPLWQIGEMNEISDCRRDWLWNILYFSNYKDDTNCMPQAWYLEADMHLHCLGVMILVLVTNSFWRKMVLAITFLVGLLAVALSTYFLNLNATLLVSPELLRNFFTNDPTFNHLYKRSHANVASFVIGLSAGILVHHWQTINFDIHKYRKFVILYWATAPCGIGLVLLCSVFYVDESQTPLYIRVIFQTLAKPVMGALYATLIIGMSFKIEKVYRGVLEWNGWAWMSRVTYSVYITHLTFIRVVLANSTTLPTITPAILIPAIGTATIAFLAAVVFWLIIEAPVNQIVKICLESSQKANHDKSHQKKRDSDTIVAKL